MSLSLNDFTILGNKGLTYLWNKLVANGWEPNHEECDLQFLKTVIRDGKQEQVGVWVTPIFTDEEIKEDGLSELQDAYGEDVSHQKVVFMPFDVDEESPVEVEGDLAKANPATIDMALRTIERMGVKLKDESMKKGIVTKSTVRAMVESTLNKDSLKKPARKTVKESREEFSVSLPYIGGGLTVSISDHRKGMIVSLFSSSDGDNVYVNKGYDYDEAIADLDSIRLKIERICKQFERDIGDALTDLDYV